MFSVLFEERTRGLMLRSLPLENTVNTSSQLENSVRYHFQVVFTSSELGNFKASPFVPLGVLDLVSSLFGPKYAENCLQKALKIVKMEDEMRL